MGWEFTQKVENATSIPALCACCAERFREEIEKQNIPIFPIGMYMRDSYLDKEV